jgi:small subunit ribosomal protein S20
VEQLVARRAHNPKVAGSNPAPATKIFINKEKWKMPNLKSAERRMRKAEKRRRRNRHYKSTMKTFIKKVKNATTREEAEAALKKVYSIFDKLVVKGIIHKNRAASYKSKLAQFVNSLPSSSKSQS